jgi:hypothetical protein
MPQVNARDLPKPVRKSRRSSVRKDGFPGEPSEAVRSNFVLGLVLVELLSVGYGIWAIDFTLTAGSAAYAVLGAILTVSASLLAYRMLVASIHLGPRGIRVISLVRHHDVPWDNVVGFEFRTNNSMSSTKYVAVKTRDGRSLKTSGLTVPNDHGKYAQSQMAQLDELRSKYSDAPTTWR